MRSAAALAAAAGLALACAHAPAPAPLPPAIPGEPPAADARLVLIGDAGVEADRPSALEAARAWVDANPAVTTVVFLGDNYYPRRRALLAEVFARQRAVGGAASTTVFVPGNHDWHPSGARLTSRVDPERLLAIAAGSGARWLPADGSFGPAALERDAFRVVAIDSELWRSTAARCPAGGDCAALRTLERELAAELDCDACAPAVLVAHHPLESVGEHGGCELSGLRRALPIGGQDLHARAYQGYVASLRRALAEHPPLLFAAGHDHSLQVALEATPPHIVSGAGGKTSPVCGDGARAWSRLGFVVLDFTAQRAPLVRVFAAEGASAREIFRAPLAR